MATKQARLPGMTPAHIEDLETKAEEVKEHESDRLDAQQRETKARGELTELMKKHGLKQYDLDEAREIVLEKKVVEEKAYVRKKKSAKGKGKSGGGKDEDEKE